MYEHDPLERGDPKYEHPLYADVASRKTCRVNDTVKISEAKL